jgi:hypothetical protein
MTHATSRLVVVLLLAASLVGCGKKESPRKDEPVAATAAPGAPALPPVGAAATPPAADGLADVRAGLLQFEQHVKWEGVSRDWAAKRAGWVQAVNGAATPQALGQQLLALETAMGWPGVQEAWKTRRAGWVSELAAASTPGAVAKLLVELETQTKWEAVTPAWAGIRPAWLAKLQATR